MGVGDTIKSLGSVVKRDCEVVREAARHVVGILIAFSDNMC